MPSASRRMWRIAAPMILSNISVPLLGMVDTGVVGHLESPVYLGAVAIGGMIFTFLYIGMNFLRMGTTGIAAQCYGAADYDGLRVALGQALVVAMFIALAILVLQVPLARIGLDLLGGEADVREHAATYVAIRVWSAPGTLANYALIGWFLGLQNARLPLAIFLTINITNIVLDLVFVLVLGMHVDGVALASVIAEYAGLAVGVSFAVRMLRRHEGHWPLARLTRFSAYRAFFSVNSNLFVRTMALMFAFAFVTAQGARLGPVILAANAVLMNFQNLTSLGLDGFAHAAEAMVGKAVGAKDKAELSATVRLTLRWSLIFAAGYTLVYLGAGVSIIHLLTDLPDVRATATAYLPWLIAAPLISAWCFLYDGVYVGMTMARQMRNIMLFSTFVVFVPTWFLSQPLGNHGLWLALMLFFASRGIGMHLGYRKAMRSGPGPQVTHHA
ncbi:MAG: MATE family efflux transporter [Gammaproteobacteria bacterium]|nr:MATE family efflux transporter [Gammaproteobacteria bacterium]NNF50481.1 MATE family efflux transporter [Woeseiaceae bacterium]MBT8093278.1 MATE family efflux transporter [Gammaproteobacteria bacterium]MBT8106084.1 MATE family efflux transporter [Gammaproteobacteria bacterium]NNK26098.1 MATE family efflux transporter [Woeseiaceae bacterium]